MSDQSSYQVTGSTVMPVGLNELKARLLELNTPDQPFMVREDGQAIKATWNLVDAKWIELFAKAGMKEQFEVTLNFDEVNNTVTATDHSYKVSWKAGVPTVSFAAEAFWGQKHKFSMGSAYGLKENLQPGEIYNFNFNTERIKQPLSSTVAAAGWRYQLGILPGVKMPKLSLTGKNKVILPIAAAVIIIGIIFGLILSFTSGPNKAVNAYFDQLKQGNFQQIYDQTDADFRQAATFSQFKQVASILQQSENLKINKLSRSTGGIAVARGTLIYKGQQLPVAVMLRKVDDKWLIMNTAIGESSVKQIPD